VAALVRPVVAVLVRQTAGSVGWPPGNASVACGSQPFLVVTGQAPHAPDAMASLELAWGAMKVDQGLHRGAALQAGSGLRRAACASVAAGYAATPARGACAGNARTPESFAQLAAGTRRAALSAQVHMALVSRRQARQSVSVSTVADER